MSPDNMATAELGINWLKRFLAAWRAVPKSVFWRGFRETPARWHKNWFTVFYFVPALPGCLGLWLYPTAITPLPTLEQATIYEGTVSILPHPSRGIGTIALKLAADERVMFSCRHGAILDTTCIGGGVLENRKKYEGKPATVWGASEMKGVGSPSYVALQIEINGEMIRSYAWMVEQFNSGGQFSNANVIAITRIFALYIVCVLIGFPYLNYRHWLSSQQPEEASRRG